MKKNKKNRVNKDKYLCLKPSKLLKKIKKSEDQEKQEMLDIYENVKLYISQKEENK